MLAPRIYVEYSLVDTEPILTPVLLQEFETILKSRLITPVFQPIVDLNKDEAEVVAYEALARGPVGSTMEMPDLLFAAARQLGCVAELDWVCQAAAFRGALDANLGRKLALFVNAEPVALLSPVPEDLREAIVAAREELRVVVEITERALTADPQGLLSTVASIRRQDWRVALDDVGADASSLALMPFISPDIIKLDLRFVQEPGHRGYARVVAAVAAEAERSGASVLAEGIETGAHVGIARSIGAGLGQGFFYGHGAPLPQTHRRSSGSLLGTEATPFSILSGRRPSRRATKELLLPISMQLEQMAVGTGEIPVILGCFQDQHRFTPATKLRWEHLAGEAVFTAAMGVGIGIQPMPHVRGADLDEDDPLRGEWAVIAVGPHFAGALVARDLGDDGKDSLRRFDYILTYDRELVIEAARALMARIVAVESPRAVQLLAKAS